ncbi:MAG: NAD(P)-dependent glycerol-1-phosphate dehydrogenase [Nitrososphaerota archaeon]|nr:NAD(P)-dependent glycerol-1-phosphate dehydrogenase [Nitrososphaerota archaeon]
MELPRKVTVGNDIASEVGKLLSDLDLGNKALVLSGPNVKELIGSDLDASLRESGYATNWERVGPSTFQEVERVAQLAKKTRVNFLVGVGGGKSIDIAKLASFNCKIPFVSIPTSASHDGIASPFASVKGLDRPYSMVAKPPVAIIADTEIIQKAPPKLMASGCGDLVSKLTAVRDWELSHIKTNEYYGRYSASLALLSANLILEDANIISSKNRESVSVVVEALISSGVAAGIAGSSRPCSGSEHLFAHAMDIVAPGKGLHGEKCGMGTIMMAKLHGMDYNAIRYSLKVIGLPTKASEIGATEDEVVKSLVLAREIRKERYTILEETKLTSESAKSLAQETGVLS